MPLRVPWTLAAATLLFAVPASLSSQQPTEIIIVAGNHALHLTKGFTPTELRALLRKIAPDAVGVENFPEWQEAGLQFHPGLPEPAVAMSWAARHRVPVYGVKNGDDIIAWQNQARSIRRMRDSVDTSTRSRVYATGLRNLVAAQATMVFEYPESIEWAHSAAGVARRAQDRTRYTEAQQSWMKAQDDTIAMGIIALVARHRPRRFAIIMGSDHYGPTRTLLEGRPGLRVLSTEQFFPLTQQEVADAWDPFDAIMILGANLDHAVARAAPHARDHNRTRRELDRLISVAPDSAPTLYYLGRWHMLFQRWPQAESLFNRVRAGAAGADERLPIAFQVRSPPLPTYHALATFALATLHDMRDGGDVARRLYQDLLTLPAVDLQPRIGETTTFDLRAYLDSLLAAPYSGGAHEYGRLLDARRPLFWNEAPEPIPTLVARRARLDRSALDR